MYALSHCVKYFGTQLLHERVFVLQPMKMAMRNTGADTNQKKEPILMVPATGRNLHCFPFL